MSAPNHNAPSPPNQLLGEDEFRDEIVSLTREIWSHGRASVKAKWNLGRFLLPYVQPHGGDRKSPGFDASIYPAFSVRDVLESMAKRGQSLRYSTAMRYVKLARVEYEEISSFTTAKAALEYVDGKFGTRRRSPRDSSSAKIDALIEENRQLREENRQLRGELAELKKTAPKKTRTINSHNEN